MYDRHVVCCGIMYVCACVGLVYTSMVSYRLTGKQFKRKRGVSKLRGKDPGCVLADTVDPEEVK